MNPEEQTEAQKAVDLAAEKVMKPYGPGESAPPTNPFDAAIASRERAFDVMARPCDEQPGGPSECRLCLKPLALQLGGACRECFVSGKAVGAPPQPTAAPGPSCDFCRRGAKAVVEAGGAIVQGPTGAHLCSSCACAAASCHGAKTAAEARAMMSLANIQAEAVKQCIDVMRLAGQEAAQGFENKGPGSRDEQIRNALTLAQAAEALAHIARGG